MIKNQLPWGPGVRITSSATKEKEFDDQLHMLCLGGGKFRGGHFARLGLGNEEKGHLPVWWTIS